MGFMETALERIKDLNRYFLAKSRLLMPVVFCRMAERR